MNNCESSDLKLVTTKSATTITNQGMIIMKKTRLRVIYLVGRPEDKMHRSTNLKLEMHNGEKDEGNKG